MARVYNEVIDVHLHGDASVKQYQGTGPLVVSLPDGRGDVRATSGDYVIYLGGVAVGVVMQAFLDPLREEDEPLDPEVPSSTGAHLEATVLDNAGAPLAKENVVLLQGGVALSEGKTDDTGLVYFNVLPGSYQVRPKDATRGPEQTVDAVLETEAAPPPEGGVTSQRRPSGPSKPSGPAKPDNTLPGNRFDESGRPDPKGSYNARGELIKK